MAIKQNYDLIIIGAGAAGLAAAIAFKRKCDGTVLVLDLNSEAGRKILATGNGRCNITNTSADGYKKTGDFFASLGILLDIETEGRVYPLNRQAVTVRDALFTEATRLGAEFGFETKATSVAQGQDDNFIIEIEPPKNKDLLESGQPKENSVDKEDIDPAKQFELSSAHNIIYGENTILARQVIVATGGKAAPQYKCFGDGYTFARQLGLKVVSISPALTYFTYSQEVKKELSVLKGVRAKATASIIVDGHRICSEYGEVQFTDKAISGICIFNLSREIKHQKVMAFDNNNYVNLKVSLDFAPNYTVENINMFLRKNTAAGLKGILNSKLADYILSKAMNENSDANDSEELSQTVSSSIFIASLVKNFEISVDGTGGWKDAQVTYGGVELSEIDLTRGESTAIPGLYFAGEVLDYDGPCGGFNLDFAWDSGITAGNGAGGYCAYYKRNNS